MKKIIAYILLSFALLAFSVEPISPQKEWYIYTILPTAIAALFLGFKMLDNEK